MATVRPNEKPQVSSQPDRRDVGLLSVAALLGAALALLGSAARTGPLTFDSSIFDTIGGLNSGPLGPPFMFLDRIGSLVLWDLVVIVVGSVRWVVSRRPDALLLVAAVVCAEALGFAVKVLVDRPRPDGGGLGDLIASASFPSGHVVRSCVAVGVLVWLAWPSPRLRWPALAGGLVGLGLMGLARVASGEHWPSDVIGGYLVGGIVLALFGAGWPFVRERLPLRKGGAGFAD